MKRSKGILFCPIAIVMLVLFSFSSSIYAQSAENNDSQKRQLIIDSVFGFDSDTIVADDQNLIIDYEIPGYLADMINSADLGAAKGGGIGALVISGSNHIDYDSFEVSFQEEAFKIITEGAQESRIHQLELRSPLVGSVRFIDRDDIARLGAGYFTLKIQKLDHKILNQEAKAVINDRPVLVVDLKVDNQELPALEGGMLFSIPYDASEEDFSQLTLYQIDASGGLKQIRNCRYINDIYRYGGDENQYYLQALIKEAGSYAIGYDKVALNDVKGWYEPYVNFVAARGIMNTNDDGAFMPHQSITRGDLAYFLANMSDETIENYTNHEFLDVSDDHPYEKSISWAYTTGVIKGYQDGTFRPDQVITRQELAVMHNRYADIIGKTYLPRKFVPQDFKDDREIASYAKESVYYLQQAGVINGRSNNHFEPRENVTRAECAKMIATVIDGIMECKTKFVPLD